MFASSRSLPLYLSLLGAPILVAPLPALAQEAQQNTSQPLTLEELPKLIGDPTTVTFTGNGVAVTEVREAMLDAAGRTDNSKWGDDPTLKNVSVNWVEVPFWKAALQMEELTGARWSTEGPAGFVLQHSGQSRIPGLQNVDFDIDLPGLAFVGRNDGGNLNGPLAFENPYLKLLATSISSNRKAFQTLGTDEDAKIPGSKTTLTLGIYPDPKLAVDSTQVSDVQVQVGNGPMMDAPKSVSRAEMSIIINNMESGDQKRGLFKLSEVELPAGLLPGTNLSTIKGNMRLNVVVDEQNWKVEDLLANPTSETTFNGMKLGYENARLENDLVKVKVNLHNGDGKRSPMAIFKLLAGVHMKDAKGHALERDMRQSNINMNANGGMSMDLSFKAPEGAKIEGPISLDWNLPSATRPLIVPFELHDVKVP